MRLRLLPAWPSAGREAARETLHHFWEEVSRTDLMFDLYSPLNQWIQALKLPPEYHPFHAAIHFFTHVLPPTLLNPFNLNPLRAVLLKLIDFERLNQSPQTPQLFLNATNIRTGKIKVFQSPGIIHRCRARFGLPPAVFPGGRNRRRALLGWRLSRQSRDLSADLSQGVQGRSDRAGDGDPARRAAGERC